MQRAIKRAVVPVYDGVCGFGRLEERRADVLDEEERLERDVERRGVRDKEERVEVAVEAASETCE